MTYEIKNPEKALVGFNLVETGIGGEEKGGRSVRATENPKEEYHASLFELIAVRIVTVIENLQAGYTNEVRHGAF